MKVFTIGYEGVSIEEFTNFLNDHKIEFIADVRKNPVSRKKGFSKSRLGEALTKNDIEYLHLPGLGVPREWRKQAKEEIITRKKMFSDYVKKVLPVEGDNLKLLKKLMKEKRLAIMCYEADASDCHRRFVVENLAKSLKGKLKVGDLRIHEELGLPSITGSSRLSRSRKSLS